MYLTESNVRAMADSLGIYEKAQASKGLSKQASAYKTVFLSHSHDDRQLVEPIRQILAGQGVMLYVDWKDPTMPPVTNADTARKIKLCIIGSDKFVMLASNRSLSSRWVPWELGIGDTAKELTNVAVFPVKPDYGTWEGNEYVGIYSRIERASSGQLEVVEPGKYSGISLKHWLER